KGVNLNIRFYGTDGNEVIIPHGGEVMYLKCMQMYVHTHPTEGDRQFAFRELNADGKSWTATDGFNQEKNILDIYMELDTSTNIFTLYVLAQGGYDAGVSNPRPESWPKEATPSADNDDDAKTAWLAHDYCHYTVYVSRASWKLNNIPEDFSWN
ncbi:MAG: hypothetical protein IJM47_01685, partial [Synergistaceae bacterium]|nr:hypothetical protein [Synergistaceae bacterium]